MARTRALDLAQMKNGLYVLPGVRRFVSAVHTDEDFEATARALDAACRAVA
jgi:glutamate-1-semialdehyde aminotransferase